MYEYFSQDNFNDTEYLMRVRRQKYTIKMDLKEVI